MKKGYLLLFIGVVVHSINCSAQTIIGSKKTEVSQTEIYTHSFKKPQTYDSLYWEVKNGSVIKSDKESIAIRWDNEGVGTIKLFYYYAPIEHRKKLDEIQVLVYSKNR